MPRCREWWPKPAQRGRALAVSLDRRDGTRTEVAGSFLSYDPLREPQMRPSPYQAFVRIMIGCDKFCTYCVVPTTRGPEQSRPPRDIVHESRILADQGVKEITLLGQTVNSYKYTEDGRVHRLSDLLAAIHEIPGILRLKFVTNYPKDMTTELLQTLRDLPKCSHYLHVPLQSGCDENLKRMKRGYTVSHYREMMGRINDILPDAAVSSDFIVGFCGETEEAHQKSLDSIREFRFKNSFIFKYSPRPGTKAYDLLPDDVPEDIKRRRNAELLTLQNQISAEDNARFIGRTVEILVEGPSKAALKSEFALEGWVPPIPDNVATPTELTSLELPVAAEPDRPQIQLTGRTMCDRIVVFDGNPRLAGTLARIQIEDCSSTTLLGSIETLTHQHGSNSLLPILA